MEVVDRPDGCSDGYAAGYSAGYSLGVACVELSGADAACPTDAESFDWCDYQPSYDWCFGVGHVEGYASGVETLAGCELSGGVCAAETGACRK